MAISDNETMRTARRRSQVTNPFTQQPMDPLDAAILGGGTTTNYRPGDPKPVGTPGPGLDPKYRRPDGSLDFEAMERDGVIQYSRSPNGPGGRGTVRYDVPPQITSDPPPAPNYSTVGSFFNRMHGYDAGKINDPKHTSEKYQIGRVLSNFDPAKGITPEVIAALNALGIGTFSGSGDRLTLSGDKGGWADGGGTDDVITDFSGKGANPQWGAYTSAKGQAQRALASGSPVMPNGQIPMPQPMAPAPRGPASNTTATRRTSLINPPNAELPDFLALNDKSQWQPGDTYAKVAARGMAAHGGALTEDQRRTLQEIIRTGHLPNASSVGDLSRPLDGGPAAEGPLMSPYGNYPGRPGNTNYTPATISQFTAPDFSEFETGQDAIIRQILANPETLNATAVAQLKEKGKEEALAMQQQMQRQMAQDALARGVSGGGYQQASERRMNEAVLSDIIRGNRDIDLQKVSQDRTDQLQALAASDALMATRGARASDFYRTGLSGELAQAGENQFAAGHALQNYGTDLDAFFNALLADDRSRGLDIQEALGNAGIGVDYARLGESGRQFDLSQQLALQQLQAQIQQFRDRLGFDYAGLNYNAQMDPWKIIFG